MQRSLKRRRRSVYRSTLQRGSVVCWRHAEATNAMTGVTSVRVESVTSVNVIESAQRML